MSIDFTFARQACYDLGLTDPISIEQDGTVWLGDDPQNKQFVPEATQLAIYAKTKELHEAYWLTHPA